MTDRLERPLDKQNPQVEPDLMRIPTQSKAASGHTSRLARQARHIGHFRHFRHVSHVNQGSHVSHVNQVSYVSTTRLGRTPAPVAPQPTTRLQPSTAPPTDASYPQTCPTRWHAAFGPPIVGP